MTYPSVAVGNPFLSLSMVDVPLLDLDPFGERASVSVKMPLSFLIQDDVESVEISLAMRAGLDLVRPGLYLISSLGVREKTDVSDNLAHLDKLNCAINRYLGVGVVYATSFGEDATMGKLIMQCVVKRPLVFIDSLSSLDPIAKLAIGPASESIKFVGTNPPADS